MLIRRFRFIPLLAIIINYKYIFTGINKDCSKLLTTNAVSMLTITMMLLNMHVLGLLIKKSSDLYIKYHVKIK